MIIMTSRLTFEDVVLSAPLMGDCNNDSLTMSGLDGVSAATVPPALCGDLSGQESNITYKIQILIITFII